VTQGLRRAFSARVRVSFVLRLHGVATMLRQAFACAGLWAMTHPSSAVERGIMPAGASQLNKLFSRIRGFFWAGQRGTDARSFDLFEDAEGLMDEIWGAEVPAFEHAVYDPAEPAFRDAGRVTETLHALAELIYFNKSRGNGENPADSGQWIREKFLQSALSDFLPGLRPVLIHHFPELVNPAETSLYLASRPHEGKLKARAGDSLEKNYFYVPDYMSTPDPRNLDYFFSVVGIDKSHIPSDYAYLIKIYHRLSVKLQRFIALSHLLMAGAQFDATISKATLTREYMLQEKIKELRSDYIAEYSTMRLAFAKRHRGLQFLEKLNDFTYFKKKHEMAISVATERLHVGTEQYPSIVKSTQKTQRIFTSLGQLLIGGYLATEILNTIFEWVAVFYHKNQYSFFVELSKIHSTSTQKQAEVLMNDFYRFESLSVYISITVVLAIIGITWYFKSQHVALHHESPRHSGGHH
jgi:hypothetical protein